MPSDYRNLLIEDLQRLEGYTFFEKPASKSLEVMGLSYFSSIDLVEWLDPRVRYILEYRSLRELPVSGAYRPSGIEGGKPGEQAHFSYGAEDVMMMNLGIFLGRLEKQSQFLLELDLDLIDRNGNEINEKVLGQKEQGLIQVGLAPFDLKILPSREGLGDFVNSVFRLSMIFHEGRHTDGEDYLHVTCPAGHDFAGRDACDNTRDGAYMVSAVVIREFVANCEDCSAREKEALRLLYLDSLNRVISD